MYSSANSQQLFQPENNNESTMLKQSIKRDNDVYVTKYFIVMKQCKVNTVMLQQDVIDLFNINE
jgi:hypothetical protein